MTYRPAAKTLFTSPSLISTAVTGPGKSAPFPTAAQVLLVMEYVATLAWVLSASATEPAAMRVLDW